MNQIVFRQVGPAGASAVAELRLAFLSGLLGEQTPDVTERLRSNLRSFLSRPFSETNYLSWIAADGDRIVAVGGLGLLQFPGNFINYEGRKGYIMNMYTVPEYRRRGIASELLNHLIATGREMGLRSFELHATKEGEPVYVAQGFQLHPEPTYRKHYY